MKIILIIHRALKLTASNSFLILVYSDYIYKLEIILVESRDFPLKDNAKSFNVNFIVTQSGYSDFESVCIMDSEIRLILLPANATFVCFASILLLFFDFKLALLF